MFLKFVGHLRHFGHRKTKGSLTKCERNGQPVSKVPVCRKSTLLPRRMARSVLYIFELNLGHSESSLASSLVYLCTVCVVCIVGDTLSRLWKSSPSVKFVSLARVENILARTQHGRRWSDSGSLSGCLAAVNLIWLLFSGGSAAVKVLGLARRRRVGQWDLNMSCRKRAVLAWFWGS